MRKDECAGFLHRISREPEAPQSETGARVRLRSTRRLMFEFLQIAACSSSFSSRVPYSYPVLRSVPKGEEKYYRTPGRCGSRICEGYGKRKLAESAARN